MHSTSPGHSKINLTGDVFQELMLDTARMVPWTLEAISGELFIVPEMLATLVPQAPQLNSLTDLLQLLSLADKHLFMQAFNADPCDQDYERLRSCELRLSALAGEPPLRFVARLQPMSDDGSRYFHGVITNADSSSVQADNRDQEKFLTHLFADSPIPSLLTDSQGRILSANKSLQDMFYLTHRQLDFALGSYSVLQDKCIGCDAQLKAVIESVYTHGIAHAVETHYSLANVHRNPFLNQQNLFFRASFLPIPNHNNVIEQVLIQLQDLSREKTVRDALQESEASYKAFITHSSEAIWCYEMQPPVAISQAMEPQVRQIANNAHLVEANKILLTMLGVESLDDVIGMGLFESGSNNYVFDINCFIENNYQLIDRDIVREDHRGKQYFFQICCTGIIEDGFLKRVWGTTKDITARKRYEDKLRYQSHHDSLTALPNRNKLYLDMETCFEQRSAEQISALLLIDLDRFKEINDTLGHNVGDHLLKLIGPRLANEMAEIPGTVARLGGDEFAVFLPRIRSAHQAVVFGHRLLDAISQEFDLEGFTTQVTGSIGIAISPHQAQDHHELMRYADIAMYHAKSQMLGLSIYSPEYDPHSTKRLAIVSELGRAIRESQLCLYYQPKVLLNEKRCYGFEALIRWIHPELGFVPPGDFIPIAELTSVIHQLTAWVLEQAIKQCRIWQTQGLSLSVAVNLSARNLMDDNIPKLVDRLLEKYQLPPGRLELEITESSIMTDPARALRNLEALHTLRVHLAIDDFGTGYSSLAYLKRLPVQTLKIDNSFVSNLLEDLQDELIVNSTIHLAHNMGLTVVAEGVENEALLTRLAEMGCDEAQGYFIGRPMTVAIAEEWMLESGWIKQPR
jgi:diguanylate cyclase (GGDEF)-like protein